MAMNVATKQAAKQSPPLPQTIKAAALLVPSESSISLEVALVAWVLELEVVSDGICGDPDVVLVAIGTVVAAASEDEYLVITTSTLIHATTSSSHWPTVSTDNLTPLSLR